MGEMSIERKYSYCLVAIMSKGHYLSIAYQGVWFEYAALADALVDYRLSLGNPFYSLTAKCQTVSIQHYISDLDRQSLTTCTTEHSLV